MFKSRGQTSPKITRTETPKDSVTLGSTNAGKEGGTNFIIVMGKSGTGKTSFINLVSNSTLRTSERLESCTEAVELSEAFEVDGCWFQLIDTPGFDDSSKSDTDILQTIATFLADEYAANKRLTGIIYMHSISDVRMGAISRRNFVMFQKFCGPDALPSVLLLTTRWDEVKRDVGEARERELMTKATFFKPALVGGASLFRHDRTANSAKNVMMHFLKRKPITLLIQREMVDEKKSLSQTEAGFELQREYFEQLQEHEKSIRFLGKELDDLKKESKKDADAEEEIAAEMKEMQQRYKRVEEERQKLQHIEYSSKIEVQTLVPSASRERGDSNKSPQPRSTQSPSLNRDANNIRVNAHIPVNAPDGRSGSHRSQSDADDWNRSGNALAGLVLVFAGLVALFHRGRGRGR